jgi:LytS/YehU family sensor histidine kinase
VFITHTYETVVLIRLWESDRVRGEQLERARVRAEREALKSHVGPHFMGNSLNTLSHFIEDDAARARIFNDHLADM